MNRSHSMILVMLFGLLGLNAQASRGGNETAYMVSNGQGIASPSYWNALEGHNPAGMVYNQSIKLQLGGGSFNGTNERYGSGGILLGNGTLGAGVEYMNRGVIDGQGMINWGLGGKIDAIRTSFGVSSQTILEGGGTFYNAGIIIEFTNRFRFGFMVPDFTHDINNYAAGLAFGFTPAVDLVVDADYNTTQKEGSVKPGLTFHSNRVQATVAYGARYKGSQDYMLSNGFSGGLGIVIANPVLFSYEYKGVVEHRVGLTLRLN